MSNDKWVEGLTSVKSEPMSINFFNKVIIEPNGDIKHNGKVVTSSEEIYKAMMEIVTLGYANCPNVKQLLEEQKKVYKEKIAMLEAKCEVLENDLDNAYEQKYLGGE